MAEGEVRMIRLRHRPEGRAVRACVSEANTRCYAMQARGHRPSWRLVIFLLPTQLATECSPEIIQRLPGLKVTKQVRGDDDLNKGLSWRICFLKKLDSTSAKPKTWWNPFTRRFASPCKTAMASSFPVLAISSCATNPNVPGRNPKTGEEIPITARRVVTFHASQKLKAMVEKNQDGKRNAE